MKILLHCLLLCAAVQFLPAQARAQSNVIVSPRESTADPNVFFQPGEWWNLYFTQADDPLRRAAASVRAVKILAVSKSHPSWVRIRFPADPREHRSIIGAMAKLKKNDEKTVKTALAKWEKTIDEWRTEWVNLDHAVSMTKVQPGGDPGN